MYVATQETQNVSSHKIHVDEWFMKKNLGIYFNCCNESRSTGREAAPKYDAPSAVCAS